MSPEETRAEIERLKEFRWVMQQEPKSFAKTQELGFIRQRLRDLTAQLERADADC